MKDKTKKILAGMCFGLVGMGCLTGCSKDAEQSALNLVTQKADEIVSLLEENNKPTNREVYEMIVLSNNVFKFSLVDEVEIKLSGKNYEMYFEKESESQPNDQILKYSMKDQVKYYNLATKGGEEWDELFVIADFNNDIYHYWNSWQANSDKSMQFGDTVSYSLSGGEILDFNFPFTKDHIYNVSVTADNEIKCTIFAEYEREINFESTDVVEMYNLIIKDNLFRRVEHYRMRGSDSEYSCMEFNYDNIDFSAMDTKYSTLLDNQA